eukprot:15304591-Alexandrium_andersonii.AAC.1
MLKGGDSGAWTKLESLSERAGQARRTHAKLPLSCALNPARRQLGLPEAQILERACGPSAPNARETAPCPAP